MLNLPSPNEMLSAHEARVVRDLRAAELLRHARLHEASLDKGRTTERRSFASRTVRRWVTSALLALAK
jgi:hypothetical protein